MWGYEEIQSFIRRQLGVRTDAASETGSIHAKLANIIIKTAAIGTSADERTDNTVMGFLNTQIKSWQRLTTTSTSASINLNISSVDPSKCLVFLNGCDSRTYTSPSSPEYSVSVTSGFPRYISAFTATTITLQSVVNGNSAGHSVIIVEFY